MAYQKAVIPMLVDPTLATRFQIGKVHHTADRVLRIARHKKITHVIVPMKVLALPAVLMQPMPRTKLDPSHYGQRHRFLSSTYRVLETQTLKRLAVRQTRHTADSPNDSDEPDTYSDPEPNLGFSR